MTATTGATLLTSGQLVPKLAGLGSSPNKQISSVYPHLNCLPKRNERRRCLGLPTFYQHFFVEKSRMVCYN